MPFNITFDPVWLYIDSPRMPLSCYACGREEEQKNDDPVQTTVRPWWIPRAVVKV